jgi:hypothetical protein
VKPSLVRESVEQLVAEFARHSRGTIGRLHRAGGLPTLNTTIVPLTLAGTYAVLPSGLRTTSRGPCRPLTVRRQRSLEVTSRVQAPLPLSWVRTPLLGSRRKAATDWL